MTTHIKGIESLHDDFDLYLIDQFGVLHNGSEPYPHAIEALEQLKLRNKQVVIVSNSGKRSAVNVVRMEGLGFSADLFNHFITSGEIAYRYLKSHLKASAVKNCFLIARDNDTSAVADLDVQLSAKPDDADMILISGSEAEKYSEDDYRELLGLAAQQNIACICTNPDKQMLTPAGLKFGAGRIAQIYEDLGGQVQWIGKPFPALYQYILTLYGDYDKHRVLCIGDSLEHDVAGGQNAELKTLLVKTGILTDVDDEQLQEQYRQYDVVPDFVAPEFIF